MTNEELQQKVKRLEEQIINLRFILESKAEEKPYEVEVSDDIETYYTADVKGKLQKVGQCSSDIHEHIYKCGGAFETSDEAILCYKERKLLFKLNKWAEEHNGEWKFEVGRVDISYTIVSKRPWDEKEVYLEITPNCYFDTFSKLPYFKSEEIAEQFIREFGDEIKEVLC